MKLDKKQLPQFIALGVLTAGVGTYAVVHLAAPGPVSAQTRPAAPVPAKTSLPTTNAKPGDPMPADAAASADIADAPPPSPTMHDPFAVGYVDPGTLPAAAVSAASKLPPGKQVAALGGLSPLPIGLPTAPALPGSGFSAVPMNVPSLPTAPPAPMLPPAKAFVPDAPKWTVTGVLQGTGGEVAILRSGDARRIVRAGDFVDSTYRVTGVTRTSVLLRHGTSVYQLSLGAKSAPSTALQASPMPAPQHGFSIPAPASAPESKLSMPAVLGSTIVPVSPPTKIPAPLAHLSQPESGLTLAAGALPDLDREPSPAKVARAISAGLRLLDGTVLSLRKE